MSFIAGRAPSYLRAALLFLTIFVSGPAVAQDNLPSTAFLNPRTIEDCDFRRLPAYGPLEYAKSESRSCIKNTKDSRHIMVCDSPESQGYPWPRSCAAIEERRCELEEKLRSQGESCRSRFSEFRRQEADRKRAEELAAKATEEAMRRDTERRVAEGLARDAAGAGDWSAMTNSARSMAKRTTRGLGYKGTPAMALSDQLSREGIGQLGRMQRFADGQLMAAMGGGAFDIDTAGGRTSSSRLPGATAGLRVDGNGEGMTAEAYSDLVAPSQEFQDMASSWNELSPISQTVGVIALIAQMVMIMESDGNVHPSLIDGSFAANVVAITEAAATGEIVLKRGEPVDAYSFTQSAVTTRLVEEDERRLAAERAEAEARRLAEEELQRQEDELRRQEEAERLAAAERQRLEEEAQQLEAEGSAENSDTMSSFIRISVPDRLLITYNSNGSDYFSPHFYNMVDPDVPIFGRCGCLEFVPGRQVESWKTNYPETYYGYRFSVVNHCENPVNLLLIKNDNGGFEKYAEYQDIIFPSDTENRAYPITGSFDHMQIFSCSAVRE